MRETLRAPAVETAPLAAAAGRVLAEDILADRDYPPFNRSARDGFAVNAADTAGAPATLECIGETRAGEPSRFTLQRGQTVEIMTGAPGPAGADAVVMVEHSSREGKRVTLHRSIAPGRNLIAAGSEAKAGAVVLRKGARIGYPQIAVLGSVGCVQAPVYKRPKWRCFPPETRSLPWTRLRSRFRSATPTHIPWPLRLRGEGRRRASCPLPGTGSTKPGG